MPRISVVLPVFNGRSGLTRAVESIRSQTVSDWELFIVSEYGSTDGTSDLAKRLAEKDERIQLIQNNERLGLAESINLGMRVSAGEFIARMDADDVSVSTRFEKQLAFFDAHPEVGICGTWQSHISPEKKWTHRPPADSEHLGASLLFTCELCHSTVMLRRTVVWQSNLFYCTQCFAEDYELWTRALTVTKLANVPEILGEYYYGNNITTAKMATLQEEHGRLSAAALDRTLGISILQKQYPLLNAWSNPFSGERNLIRRQEMLVDYKKILEDIWKANQERKFFEDAALLDVLRARWLWAKWGLQDIKATAESLEDIFAPIEFSRIRLGLQIWRRNPNPWILLKKLWNRMGAL